MKPELLLVNELLQLLNAYTPITVIYTHESSMTWQASLLINITSTRSVWQNCHVEGGLFCNKSNKAKAKAKVKATIVNRRH
jgi:hypothetical protein